MKAAIFFLLAIIISNSIFCQQNIFSQLVYVNNEWTKQINIDANLFTSPSKNLNEVELIQLHLQETEKLLRAVSTQHLSTQQKSQRSYLLDVLNQYCIDAKFPINTLHHNRQPYFIDDYNTYCAVGYLMKQSGANDLAVAISQSQNYQYLKDITHPALMDWVNKSGLSFNELALIQPGYGANWIPYITEIHYNNIGTDVNEYIEIRDVVFNGNRYDSVYFYNKQNVLYKAVSKTNFTSMPQAFTYLSFNGVNDTLSNEGKIEIVKSADININRYIMTEYRYNNDSTEVKYFYSNGSMLRTDIFKVVETENTPVGNSLNYCNYFISQIATILTTTIGSINSCILLPVQFKSFTANQEGKSVKLIWQTLTEVNNNYFEVEKSEDGYSFKTLGKVNSKNQNGGESYSFIDETPAYISHYRLKQVDKDGKFSYSKILYIQVNEASIFKVLNNPITHQLNIFITKNEFSNNTLRIYDLQGKNWLSEKVTSSKISLNVGHLANGNYIVELLTKQNVFRQQICIKK